MRETKLILLFTTTILAGESDGGVCTLDSEEDGGEEDEWGQQTQTGYRGEEYEGEDEGEDEEESEEE